MPHLRNRAGGAAGSPNPGDIVGGVDVSNPSLGGAQVIGTPAGLQRFR